MPGSLTQSVYMFSQASNGSHGVRTHHNDGRDDSKLNHHGLGQRVFPSIELREQAVESEVVDVELFTKSA